MSDVRINSRNPFESGSGLHLTIALFFWMYSINSSLNRVFYVDEEFFFNLVQFYKVSQLFVHGCEYQVVFSSILVRLVVSFAMICLNSRSIPYINYFSRGANFSNPCVVSIMPSFKICTSKEFTEFMDFV